MLLVPSHYIQLFPKYKHSPPYIVLHFPYYESYYKSYYENSAAVRWHIFRHDEGAGLRKHYLPEALAP